MFFLAIFLILFPSLYIVLWYKIKRTVWCRSQTCLAGKTAIITGANTGIGFETALDFAKRGARVILACRNGEKAQMAKSKIIEQTGNGNVVVKIINLASLESVRAFAKEINNTETTLHILVNNAGAGGLPNKKTEDGLELLTQVNYFSSFLLTHLLRDLLEKSAPSRVINISSLAAKHSDLRPEHLNTFRGFYKTYANSKLGNILFTKLLAKKLAKSKITVFSVHPGVVKTEIFRHLRGKGLYVIEFFKRFFFKTCEEGAQSTIYAAVAKNIEGFSGSHFDNCQIVSYPSALVPGLAEEIWTKTEEILKLDHKEKIA